MWPLTGKSTLTNFRFWPEFRVAAEGRLSEKALKVRPYTPEGLELLVKYLMEYKAIFLTSMEKILNTTF